MGKLLKLLRIPSVIKLLVLIANIFIAVTLILLYNISRIKDIDDFIFVDNDLACHYLQDQGALKTMNDLIVFPPNSIYFVESSCEGLTSRQACAAESAARANPDKQINLLFTSPISWDIYKTSGIETLMGISNVEAARIHIAEYAKGTPINDILSKKPVSRSALNTSIDEILKFITIYKYSGIYLGLDVIVARSFDDMYNNWVVKESPTTISSEIFAFSDNTIGRSLANIALNILLADQSLPDRQDYKLLKNANTMLQLVTLWCATGEIQELNTSSCKDLQIHEPDLFFPIPLHDRNKYFQQGDWNLLGNDTIYTFHSWGHLTKYHIVPEDSLYDKLAQKYCPHVFSFYGSQFGLF